MAASLIGALVANRYRIVRALGEGGMGSVYVAIQESLDREIAIKVIRAAQDSKGNAQERFQREARVIAQLQHPNIVAFLDYGLLDDGRIFLAMEYAAGRTLNDALKEQRFSFAETVPIISSICSALWTAHQKGVIHRDIKHENIVLVGESRIVKLLDFGIAKLITEGTEAAASSATAALSLTGTGQIVGTAGYIAPEVLRGEEAEPRSDLYSLGVVWWELLCRQRLFESKQMMSLVTKHCFDPPRLPTSLGVALPAAAEALLMQMLAKTPAGRPKTALEIVDWLREISAAIPVGAPAASSTTLDAAPVDTVWGAQTQLDAGSATVPLARADIDATKTRLDE